MSRSYTRSTSTFNWCRLMRLFRAPTDLIVIRADALERLRATDELVTAADVILVVEILAPTSVRTDT